MIKTYHCKQIKVSACLITMQSSNIGNKSICEQSLAPAIFHLQIKFKVATYFHASCWCGYLHLVDELQTDRFLSPEFEIFIVYSLHLYVTKSYK